MGGQPAGHVWVIVWHAEPVVCRVAFCPAGPACLATGQVHLGARRGGGWGHTCPQGEQAPAPPGRLPVSGALGAAHAQRSAGAKGRGSLAGRALRWRWRRGESWGLVLPGTERATGAGCTPTLSRFRGCWWEGRSCLRSSWEAKETERWGALPLPGPSRPHSCGSGLANCQVAAVRDGG